MKQNSQVFHAQCLISVPNNSLLFFLVVGEEDELSIKEAAELLMEGMQFTGKVEVSSVRCCYLSAGGSEGLYIKW